MVDCSVAAKWPLTEPGRIHALRLLDEQESGKFSLIAPDLVLIEFASLITKRARGKQMSAAQAYQAFRLMEQSELHLIETRPLLGPALNLALRQHLSLWDCVYPALAIEHGSHSSPPTEGSSRRASPGIQRFAS